jgi:GT2 family glycosyltransferase
MTEKRYSANPLYRTKRIGKSYYLRHQNGARIKTDRIINLIWAAADGLTAAEIQAKMDGRTYTSSWLLGNTLDLMVKADLLRTDSKPATVVSPEPSLTGPLVSVIVVNKDGAEHLSALLPSLVGQDYPNIELVLVDNASKDDSVELTRRFFPDAKIIELDKNIGFSPGNNVGIAEAAGDYIFLLNNDTELAHDCISRLVEKSLENEDVAAVVPKMFLWRLPKFLNGIGNSVTNHGWGGDNYIGYLDLGQFDDIEDMFGACFGAVLITRDVLDRVGLLDPYYMFYYEDADWSYRAHLLGYKITCAPEAIVYHKFSASMNTLEPNFKWRLVISNRLRFISKNLSKGVWLNFMRNYAKEDLRGFMRSAKHKDWAMARTYLSAWGRFLAGVPSILSARRKIQKSRVVSDARLINLWTDLPPLMDQQGNPVFDVATVRRIYTHFLPPVGPLTDNSVASSEDTELSLDA